MDRPSIENRLVFGGLFLAFGGDPALVGGATPAPKQTWNVVNYETDEVVATGFITEDEAWDHRFVLVCQHQAVWGEDSWLPLEVNPA